MLIIVLLSGASHIMKEFSLNSMKKQWVNLFSNKMYENFSYITPDVNAFSMNSFKGGEVIVIAL